MAVNYNFGKNRDSDPVGVYTDVARFFSHLAHTTIVLQGFELKPDGTITIRSQDPIPPEHLEHFGLVP